MLAPADVTAVALAALWRPAKVVVKEWAGPTAAAYLTKAMLWDACDFEASRRAWPRLRDVHGRAA